MRSPPTQDATAPSARKLTLNRETLRRLTAPELRLAAGGRRACSHNVGCPTVQCHTDGCWTWYCPK